MRRSVLTPMVWGVAVNEEKFSAEVYEMVDERLQAVRESWLEALGKVPGDPESLVWALLSMTYVHSWVPFEPALHVQSVPDDLRDARFTVASESWPWCSPSPDRLSAIVDAEGELVAIVQRNDERWWVEMLRALGRGTDPDGFVDITSPDGWGGWHERY